ncbi:unnamed protein product, partial [Ectocarpus sp. 12 AP-2014]
MQSVQLFLTETGGRWCLHLGHSSPTHTQVQANTAPVSPPDKTADASQIARPQVTGAQRAASQPAWQQCTLLRSGCTQKTTSAKKEELDRSRSHANSGRVLSKQYENTL